MDDAGEEEPVLEAGLLETGALDAGFGAGAGASLPFSGSSARSFFVATLGVVLTTGFGAGLDTGFLLAALLEDAALELTAELTEEELAAELTTELADESTEEAEELKSQSAVAVFEAV